MKPNPDHSVNDLEVPAELRAPKPRPEPPKARRPWWVCLLKFLAKLILRRKS